MVVTVAQRGALERLLKAYTTPAHIQQRARIVLLSAEGALNVRQAAELDIDPQRVRRWRRRWEREQPAIVSAEAANGAKPFIDDLVYDVLSDEQRTGRKPVFTAEQIASIIAVACEKPSEESERAVTHWTPRELAAEVMKRGIVATISARHVGRLLQEADLKPHRSRYWLQRQEQGHRPRRVRGSGDGRVRDLPTRP